MTRPLGGAPKTETKTMNRILLVAAVGVSIAAAGTTMAADYEAGRKKAAEVCAACHGEDGNKTLTPDTPRLAGQYYDYIVHALLAFQKGKRENPLMSPMAKPLTREDIHNVAYFFSKQKGLETKY
jgi:cytochrome c553